ncbi:MAG TPA: NUDIX domain-containing protein [Jatrophihabitantaceae bacterium]|nr:NUDIX domain-containing protein [Jatrophihabitantaceae bacterium]
MRPTISVSAGVVLDGRGRVLLVRKTDTSVFMNPGGKPAPGESAAEALCRELAEEVGLAVRPGELTYLGRFRAEAANEPGHLVDAEVFAVTVADVDVTPQLEIAEAVWVDLGRADVALAPLAANHLLPAAARLTGLRRSGQRGGGAPAGCSHSGV